MSYQEHVAGRVKKRTHTHTGSEHETLPRLSSPRAHNRKRFVDSHVGSHPVRARSCENSPIM